MTRLAGRSLLSSKKEETQFHSMVLRYMEEREKRMLSIAPLFLEGKSTYLDFFDATAFAGYALKDYAVNFLLSLSKQDQVIFHDEFLEEFGQIPTWIVLDPERDSVSILGDQFPSFVKDMSAQQARAILQWVPGTYEFHSDADGNDSFGYEDVTLRRVSK